ncbi:MAG: nucleoside triphosphate pyrophosphohydrolase [Gammaproteobacteria bacterium]|nr:nucleoside triphosphate pyrophosphohydrolase [Gammaproteobacteria bacterium]
MPKENSPPQGASRSINTLLEVMTRLRDPATGCPWDRAQDFHTIAPYTIEEAYEVADAISRGDMDALVDELGDLLFQVVFHAQMASEAEAFDFGDVVTAIVEKMVRRHPHVFASKSINDADQQSLSWEAHKAAERKKHGMENEGDSLLDHVPESLPAVKRGQKLQQRAATAGFDWPTTAGVMAKIEEELAELCQTVETGAAAERVEAELGDLMFSCINLARHLKIDAEMALRSANTKFERRFRFMEHKLASDGRSAAEADLDVLEALWEEAKSNGL